MVQQIFVQTNKSFIPPLPRFSYDGRIYVIHSEEEAIKAVEVLRKSQVLGIDTETRPSFRKGDSHKVALLQIANDDLCFLFRLNEIGLPPCIANLLSDPDILKVGLSLKDDFLMLRRRSDNFKANGYIELQEMANKIGIKDMSLQKLYANLFHKRISKSARLSNWEADTLSESQKVYAATDAVTCIHLYRELKRLQETRDYVLVDANQPS